MSWNGSSGQYPIEWHFPQPMHDVEPTEQQEIAQGVQVFAQADLDMIGLELLWEMPVIKRSRRNARG